MVLHDVQYFLVVLSMVVSSCLEHFKPIRFPFGSPSIYSDLSIPTGRQTLSDRILYIDDLAALCGRTDGVVSNGNALNTYLWHPLKRVNSKGVYTKKTMFLGSLGSQGFKYPLLCFAIACCLGLTFSRC